MKRLWVIVLTLAAGCEVVGRMEVRSDFKHPDDLQGNSTAVVAIEWRKNLSKEARHARTNETCRTR